MKFSTVLLCMSLAVTAISIDKVPYKDSMDCPCSDAPEAALACSCLPPGEQVKSVQKKTDLDTGCETFGSLAEMESNGWSFSHRVFTPKCGQYNGAPATSYCGWRGYHKKLTLSRTPPPTPITVTISFSNPYTSGYVTASVNGVALDKAGPGVTLVKTYALKAGDAFKIEEGFAIMVINSFCTEKEEKTVAAPPQTANPTILGHIQLNGQNICIDAAERNKDGGLVHMVYCDRENENQMWSYANKQIKIVNGKCLDCHGEGKCHMNTCDPANGNQKFDYDAATSQIKSHSTQKCMDSPTRKSSGEVYVTQCNTANHNQQFTIKALGTYRGQIKINDSALCVDASESNKDGGKVHMWTCDEKNANQQWVYDTASLHIKHIHGRCLDCYQPHHRYHKDTKCHMNTCNPANGNQKFAYDTANFQIKALLMKKCLDSPHRHEGGKVYVTQCNPANHNQQFAIGN